jgi:hypothetical protein
MCSVLMLKGWIFRALDEYQFPQYSLTWNVSDSAADCGGASTGVPTIAGSDSQKNSSGNTTSSSNSNSSDNLPHHEILSNNAVGGFWSQNPDDILTHPVLKSRFKYWTLLLHKRYWLSPCVGVRRKIIIPKKGGQPNLNQSNNSQDFTMAGEARLKLESMPILTSAEAAVEIRKYLQTHTRNPLFVSGFEVAVRRKASASSNNSSGSSSSTSVTVANSPGAPGASVHAAKGAGKKGRGRVIDPKDLNPDGTLTKEARWRDQLASGNEDALKKEARRQARVEKEKAGQSPGVGSSSYNVNSGINSEVDNSTHTLGVNDISSILSADDPVLVETIRCVFLPARWDTRRFQFDEVNMNLSDVDSVAGLQSYFANHLCHPERCLKVEGLNGLNFEGLTVKGLNLEANNQNQSLALPTPEAGTGENLGPIATVLAKHCDSIGVEAARIGAEVKKFLWMPAFPAKPMLSTGELTVSVFSRAAFYGQHAKEVAVLLLINIIWQG